MVLDLIIIYYFFRRLLGFITGKPYDTFEFELEIKEEKK